MTNRNKTLKSVEQLNVIDDSLFQKMAEDIGFCEEMISTILDEKVKVLEVIPQDTIKNLQGRSVVLDALCELEDSSRCNVEVHKADDDDHVKRVRYNASCITANVTEPGTKFEKVPDVISIFISKFDIFKANKTVYHIDRVIRETGEMNDNGWKEIYVNTKVDDGSDIAELMRIFKEQSAYNFEKFPKTSTRKKHFLQNVGGKQEMCEIVENYAKEYAKEYAEEQTKKQAEIIAENLFKSGASFELIKNGIETLSDEELLVIYNKVMGTKE